MTNANEQIQVQHEDEVLRLVQDPETADRAHVRMWQEWAPEDETVEPPPGPTAEGATRDEAYGCVDWYNYKRRTVDQPSSEV